MALNGVDCLISENELGSVVVKPRNHKAAYLRRIERGQSRGLSRSQARGHPRAKERSASSKKARAKFVYDAQLEQGLKLMRSGSNLTKAAQSIRVSRERLRRYLAQTGVVRRKGNKWLFRKDKRRRQVLIFSGGREFIITVASYEVASKIGSHREAVAQFLATNDPAHLKPYVGEIVQDVDGKSYLLETRPNVLYRIASGGIQSFEQIYQIIT